MNSTLSVEIREVLEEVLAVQLKPIIKRLDSIEKEQKKQATQIKELQKTLDVARRVFDREDVRLQKREKRIEDHLGLPRMA